MPKQWFILQQDKSGLQPMDGEHYATEEQLIRSMIYADEGDEVFEYDTDAMTFANVTQSICERAHWHHADEMHDLIADGYCGLIASVMEEETAHILDAIDGGATRAEAENELRWNGAA